MRLRGAILIVLGRIRVILKDRHLGLSHVTPTDSVSCQHRVATRNASAAGRGVVSNKSSEQRDQNSRHVSGDSRPHNQGTVVNIEA